MTQHQASSYIEQDGKRVYLSDVHTRSSVLTLQSFLTSITPVAIEYASAETTVRKDAIQRQTIARADELLNDCGVLQITGVLKDVRPHGQGRYMVSLDKVSGLNAPVKGTSSVTMRGACGFAVTMPPAVASSLRPGIPVTVKARARFSDTTTSLSTLMSARHAYPLTLFVGSRALAYVSFVEYKCTLMGQAFTGPHARR